MKWLVTIIIFFIAPVVFASIEEVEFSQLKKAVSSEALNLTAENFKALKIMLRACEIQINEELLPSACYKALNSAKKLGVENELEMTSSKVNNLCLKAAQKTSEVRNPITQSMSAECFERAEAQVRLNQYKAGHEF